MREGFDALLDWRPQFAAWKVGRPVPVNAGPLPVPGPVARLKVRGHCRKAWRREKRLSGLGIGSG
jgi:hypothetical protein